MKISVEDVSIKTASIEVKVLTLSRKQVTQSVFRQLDMTPIVDIQNGVPFFISGQIWGRVNYHHKCRLALEHIHIVFELEKEIYHDILYRHRDHQQEYYKSEYKLDYIRKYYCSPEELDADEEEQNEITEWCVFYDNIEARTDHLFIAV